MKVSGLHIVHQSRYLRARLGLLPGRPRVLLRVLPESALLRAETVLIRVGAAAVLLLRVLVLRLTRLLLQRGVAAGQVAVTLYLRGLSGPFYFAVLSLLTL